MAEQAYQGQELSSEELACRIFGQACEADDMAYAIALSSEYMAIQAQKDRAWQDRILSLSRPDTHRSAGHSAANKEGLRAYELFKKDYPDHLKDEPAEEVNAGNTVDGLEPVPEELVGDYTGEAFDWLFDRAAQLAEARRNVEQGLDSRVTLID